jgi:hypothetical protein
MDIKTELANWANSSNNSELAFELFNNELEPGDLSSLDSALDDFSFDIEPELPKSLLAYRLSLWAGKPISVDSPLVQNNKDYKELVMDLDYPDDLDKNKINKLKSFALLLKNSISNEYSDSVLEGFKNIIGMSKNHKVKKVLIIKGGHEDGIITLVLDDDTFVFIKDEESRGYDKNGKQTGITEKDCLWKSAPKKVITDEQLISIIGMKLYNLLRGNDTISLFDLPG